MCVGARAGGWVYASKGIAPLTLRQSRDNQRNSWQAMQPTAVESSADPPENATVMPGNWGLPRRARSSPVQVQAPVWTTKSCYEQLPIEDTTPRKRDITERPAEQRQLHLFEHFFRVCMPFHITTRKIS